MSDPFTSVTRLFQSARLLGVAQIFNLVASNTSTLADHLPDHGPTRGDALSSLGTNLPAMRCVRLYTRKNNYRIYSFSETDLNVYLHVSSNQTVIDLDHSSDYTRVHVLVESVVLLSLVEKDFSRVQKEEGRRVCS